MKLLLGLLILAALSSCFGCATTGAPAPAGTVQTSHGKIQPWLNESQTINRQDNQRQRWENHRHGEIQPWIPTGLE